MKNRIARLLLLVLAAGLMGACRNPIGPGKKDPDWPNPARDGEKPVVINRTITVETNRSNVVIFIEKMTPREGGTAKVGQLGQVWTRITNNNSGEYLSIYRTGISDGPEDNPGQIGRTSLLFSAGRVETIAPGQSRSLIFGFNIREPETIPHLRLSGKYYPDAEHDGLGPWTIPDWTHDIRLSWTLTP